MPDSPSRLGVAAASRQTAVQRSAELLDDKPPPVSHAAGISGAPLPEPGGAPPAVEREFTVVARSQWRTIAARFARHRLALISAVLFVLVVLFSFLGPLLWKFDHTQNFTGPVSKPPTGAHPFGTDDIGHDVLAQVMRGGQQSLKISLFVAVVSTVIGTVYGLVSGYAGGGWDNLLMRIVDLVLTLPLLAIAAVLAFKFSSNPLLSSWFGVAVVLAVLLWAPIARVVRGVVLSLREREFIEAAHALGASRSRILFRHLLPNVSGPVIVNATVYVSIAILTETSLSFLGFGVKQPDVSLGTLIYYNQTAISTRPWLFYIPGVFIVIIALTINFIGDGLRDALDPQQNRVRS